MHQYLAQMPQYLVTHTWVMLLIVLWVLPWKGVALWKAARANQPIWFVALLVINTLAVLEIVYIFFFSKKSHAEHHHS